MSGLRHIALPWSGDRFPLTSLVLDGVTWEITCNGHALAAVKVERSDFLAVARTLSDRYTEILAKPVRAPDAVVTLGQVVAIVGAAEPCREERCEDCGGSGRARDADGDCDCDNCLCSCDGGKQWTRVKMRPIALAGIGVNANLIACALEAISAKDAGPIEVWGERIGDFDTNVRLFADGWRVLVMGMRVEEDVPRFLEPGRVVSGG